MLSTPGTKLHILRWQYTSYCNIDRIRDSIRQYTYRKNQPYYNIMLRLKECIILIISNTGVYELCPSSRILKEDRVSGPESVAIHR
jgi:hypothetical protein